MKSTPLASIIVTAVVTLAGCASAPLMPLTRPNVDSQGEIVVFREYAFAAGGVGLTVGANNAAFASLGNTEKVRAFLPLGSHDLFVQARAAEPTTLKVNIQPGSLVCLRASANPSTYAKVVIPITLMVTGYHFYLDEVACPSTQELAKYKDVQVTYK